MQDEKLDAARLNEIIQTLPDDAKRYLRMCIEHVVRCFMDDSTQVGVLVTAKVDEYGMQVYSMGLDDRETTTLLTAVLYNKHAEDAAMKMPKEKLN
jgi:hypothetical protein